MWDDVNDSFNIHEFMKRDFMKFSIQIQKWSKDIHDVYVVSITLITSYIKCLLLHEIGNFVTTLREKLIR